MTSPSRTLLDRAATLTIHELERELDEALIVLQIVHVQNSRRVARAIGHCGAGRLRSAARAARHGTITQSEAERLFLALIRKAGFPNPRPR